MTMSPLVLCTIAKSSFRRREHQTFHGVSKSFQKAAHSASVILSCSWDSRIARPLSILLRSTRGPLRNQIFEAGRTEAVMGLVNSRIRIQNRIAQIVLEVVKPPLPDSLFPNAIGQRTPGSSDCLGGGFLSSSSFLRSSSHDSRHRGQSKRYRAG